MGISNLISTYCSKNDQCQKSTVVLSVVRKFEGLLGNDCYTLGELEEDIMVTALKGLRNIGFVTTSAPVIIKCANTYVNQNEVRLAAFDLMHKLSCDNRALHNNLMATFGDIMVDSEMRIAAYNALMACPTKGTIDTMRNLLNFEESNQGNIYIVTKKNNIQITYHSWGICMDTSEQLTRVKEQYTPH